MFVGLTSRLRVPLADGLAEQVRTAACDHGIKRWRLYLTPEQMESVAYGLWLHRMTGSAAEANRFAREYGVVHSPARASNNPSAAGAAARGGAGVRGGEGGGDGRCLLQTLAAGAADLVKAGKVRYLGASSMHAWEFAKALHLQKQNQGLQQFVEGDGNRVCRVSPGRRRRPVRVPVGQAA